MLLSSTNAQVSSIFLSDKINKKEMFFSSLPTVPQSDTFSS
jgi:hypothetical protein